MSSSVTGTDLFSPQRLWDKILVTDTAFANTEDYYELLNKEEEEV